MIDHSPSLEFLQSHQLPNGGFSYTPGRQARPDCTAWAVLALSAFKGQKTRTNSGRDYLSGLQDSDGRVPVSSQHPGACWPTPLAILAWNQTPEHQQAKNRAIDFLVGFTGHHFPKPPNSVSGHDPAIRGWPWIADTHSWVVPTSLSIMALQSVGLGTHGRVKEGIRMILDRQLAHGGWNYGSPMAFGKELHPLPEATGMALQALAGMIERDTIEGSIQYLMRELPRFRTPVSLGWTLLGLGAWGIIPPDKEDMIETSLTLQKRYGPYPLPSLALLLYASQSPEGVFPLLAEDGSAPEAQVHQQASQEIG